MRFISILIILLLLTLKADNTRCYSIEILTEKYTPLNFRKLNDEIFPNSCKVLKIENTLSVRCGCYQTKKRVVEIYKLFRKGYLDISIKQTSRHRFEKVN